jgi:hypothetical protein
MNPLFSRIPVFIISATMLCFVSSSVAAGDDEQDAPATSNIVIPATAGAKHPVVVGKVKEGQVVTMHIGRVLWGGGGSEGKKPTNWRGYLGRYERNGLPWMALVASVKHKDFLPDKKDFTFTVPQDGVLAVFANDDNPNGNTGKGEVTVTVSEPGAKEGEGVKKEPFNSAR